MTVDDADLIETIVRKVVQNELRSIAVYLMSQEDYLRYCDLVKKENEKRGIEWVKSIGKRV